MTNIALTPNQLITNLTNIEDAWGHAMALVDYPVMVKPLHFYYENEDGKKEEYPASGYTNTLRETNFHGIVVDRHKDGHLSTIATVTDTYGTIPAAKTYHMLMTDLNEMGVEAAPRELYVSGSGGRQVLNVDIEGQMAPNMQDEIGMQVKLLTSLDGSKKHTVQLVAFDKTNNAELVGITSESFNLSARHTKTIEDRHIAFQTTIGKLIAEWNDTIMPTMALMGDATFDRATAVELLANITEDADLAEKHQKSAENSYLSKMMDEGGQHSIYSVMSGLSIYIQGALADDKPETAEKVRTAINKKAHKHINKALKQLGLDTI